MRRPRKRWLLTIKIALCGSLLMVLLATGLELSYRADERVTAGALPASFEYRIIAWSALSGLHLGLMVGLVVNAIAMIIEEPRPHW